MDMRDACFGEVYKRAMGDERLIVLVNDMGAWELEKVREERPRQYLNMGPAEQNMVEVATGLALEGFQVVMYGIANFVTLRCYEQIKVDVALLNLPVVIVGAGPGYSYGAGGPTHHATEDLEIMSLLPNMTVYHPCDGVSARELMKRALDERTPHYLSIERGDLPDIYHEGQGFSAGRTVLRNGDGPSLFASGYMTHTALRVAALALARHGMSVPVIDCYQWKSPMPAGMLRERSKAFFLSHGSREYVHKELGLDAESILASLQAKPREG